ncbi:UDP-N-acetylmuramoyl-tripeptide--D-alanyl-D-alanine ligase [candidate division KSB1 bacterium]
MADKKTTITVNDLHAIPNAVPTLPAGYETQTFSGVSIDSRTVNPGDLFFAVRGDNFDGHDFLQDVLRKGVNTVVVEKNRNIRDDKDFRTAAIVQVPDTRKALGDLALIHRNKFDIPVIGITGTCGKTSTKEMIAAVLEKKFKVLKTPGNYNNLIGLPLTLFTMTEDHTIAILEMGASYPGEIAEQCEIVRPIHGIITNIGKGHLEFFKTLDEVFDTKSALIRAVQSAGSGFINGDDTMLQPLKQTHDNILTFGTGAGNDVTGEDIVMNENGCCSFSVGKELDVTLQVPGRQNVLNALAAAAVGMFFTVESRDIQDALASYKGFSQRMQITEWNGVTIINDAYNANPSSMLGALDFLQEFPVAGRRFAALGDMLELGDISRSEHETIGEETGKRGVHRLITVGNHSKYISETANISGMTRAIHATDHEQAAKLLRRETAPGDVVLVKGSRGSTMEKTIKLLTGEQ